MLTYILRRFLLMLPTLLGITLVVFVVMASAPGGISAQSLVEGQNLEPEAKKALEDYYNQRYGLDDPAPVQYFRWLNNISPVGFEIDENGDFGAFSFDKGSDLGTSFRYGRPVVDLIAERAPITVLLNVLSIPIVYFIAILIGLRAATQRGSSFDVTSSVSMLALWSAPTMLVGVLLIGFFANQQYWHWFPTSGLSFREALDMPFLPHWSSLWDVLKLFISVALSFSVFLSLALSQKVLLRAGVMALSGALLGYLFLSALPDALAWPWLVASSILFGGLFYSIARSDYLALRVLMMGSVGLCVGTGLGFEWMSGEWLRGFLLDRVWHLVLPLLCLTYGGFAFLAKLTRSSVLENLFADYARTARAKGVPENEVLWRHVFRNSLIPLITVTASLLPGLLAGSVIVESIFSIDGMGKLAVEAVKARDRELVLSITLISGVLTLIGYLIADLLYALVDPRVSYD